MEIGLWGWSGRWSFNRPWQTVVGAAVASLLVACSTSPVSEGTPGRDASDIPDAVPRPEPRSPYGNPPSYEVNGHRFYTMESSEGYVERGIASWYGPGFHGRRTSSGEPYDMYAMTAAHTRLPLPTYVQVTNLENSRQAILRVNDRGPFEKNRLIDLSYAAATKLGIYQPGTALVEVRALDPGAAPPAEARPVAALPRPLLYLQVGAFAQRENAERLRERLLGADLRPCHITALRSGSQLLYRLRIGPLDSVERADALIEPLTRLGLPDARIVVDGPGEPMHTDGT